MKIEEACGCGAAFSIETSDDGKGLSEEAVVRRVEKFRQGHRHPAPQGPSAIGYPLPEPNNGYDETGDPHGKRMGFK